MLSLFHPSPAVGFVTEFAHAVFIYLLNAAWSAVAVLPSVILVKLNVPQTVESSLLWYAPAFGNDAVLGEDGLVVVAPDVWVALVEEVLGERRGRAVVRGVGEDAREREDADVAWEVDDVEDDVEKGGIAAQGCWGR